MITINLGFDSFLQEVVLGLTDRFRFYVNDVEVSYNTGFLSLEFNNVTKKNYMGS